MALEGICNRFLKAYSFDYDGSLGQLKTSLEAKTGQIWNNRERAFLGKYIRHASEKGIVRIFESHVVDIRNDHPRGSYEDWKQHVVKPVIEALTQIGAKNFEEDDGNY